MQCFHLLDIYLPLPLFLHVLLLLLPIQLCYNYSPLDIDIIVKLPFKFLSQIMLQKGALICCRFTICIKGSIPLGSLWVCAVKAVADGESRVEKLARLPFTPTVSHRSQPSITVIIGLISSSYCNKE